MPIMYNFLYEYYEWATGIFYQAYNGFPQAAVHGCDTSEVGPGPRAGAGTLVSQLFAAGRTPLQYCLHQYHTTKSVTCQLIILVRDLLVALILLLYKLFVITYRLTLGMIRDDTEETTVPDLIKSHGYQVNSNTDIILLTKTII